VTTTADSPSASTRTAAPVDTRDPEAPEPRYINRDLSWLDFNARVLDLAADGRVPLLERVKFLAIFSQNLDEFFQVRVAGLRDQLEAGLGPPGPDGLTPHETLVAVKAKVTGLLARHSGVYADEIVPALAGAGMGLCNWEDLDDEDRRYVVGVFNTSIFPVLTPLSVDPAHPFPYISNLSLNLAVIVRDPVTGDRRFARVKVPPLLPRFVVLRDRNRVVALEQIIAAHLDLLFPGMEVEAHHTFRVTRNADLAVEEEEADDLLAAVEMELRRRRFGEAVRLEVDASVTPEVRELLTRELALGPDDVYDIEGPHDLGGLWAVTDLDRPDLKDDAWAPMTQPGLATASNEPVDLFGVIREHDVLVHYPYDSFATSVEAFVAQASTDPHVLAIKQTLYRTSGDSQIVRSLVEAAERGKQVVALVELKARFDEQRNIEWARALEEAGCHVVYGLVGYKTHAKLLLVVRQDDDGVRRYCHVGTGNYNAKTARLYEDFGLLSCDPALGADLTGLFNYLTGYARAGQYERLLVAPTTLRPRIIELIGEQAARGEHGRIVMKMNSLHDQLVIDALYDASRAGVPIELIVRGICGLVPGVPGLSETIRVRSILGRFLEHSRVFVFGGNDDQPARYFVGSADMMPGNLDRRIEAVTPVLGPELQRRVHEVVDTLLADDAPAWMLRSDETWERVNADQVGVQRRLQELALARARRRRDPETAPLE